jgi:hypothetical protein
MAPLAPVIGPHPGPGWRISMQRGGRTGAAAYRGARPGMVQQPQPAAGQLNPVQPSGGVDPNLKVLGERRARAAATQSPGSTSGLALGGLVATEKA